MKRFSILLGVVALAVLLPGLSRADNAVRIALDAYNPPNMYLKDGEPAGLYPILIKSLFLRMDREVCIQAVPWKRAMEMGRLGLAGIGAIYKTEERQKIFEYSEPVYNELLQIFVRRGEQFPFESVKDLEGKRIGCLLGWSYGEQFDKARKEGLFFVEAVNRDALNFKKLSEGRLNCVVASKESGAYEIARNGLVNIIPLEEALLINPTYIAFAKSSQQAGIITDLNTALEAMRQDGEYSQLVKDFFDHIASNGTPKTKTASAARLNEAVAIP